MSLIKMRAAVATAVVSVLGLTVTTVPSEAAPTCLGKPVTIDLNTQPDAPGTSGADVIVGTPGIDIINGSGGADTICARGGDDVINGDSGNDVLNPGAGNDDIFGGTGIDTVDYSNAPSGITFEVDTLVEQPTGGSGNDKLNDVVENVVGSPFADFLEGDEEDNVIKGKGGNDRIFPGLGTDVVNGGGGVGTVDIVDFQKEDTGVTVDLSLTTQETGTGIKTIKGFESIAGSPFNDVLSGTAANDSLAGFGGADTLRGRDGADTLGGGLGNDTLLGGTGSPDVCDGSTGADTYSGCESINDPDL